MTDKLERLPRCCPRHTDWRTLTDHLVRDFPTVDEELVLRSVLEAERTTERFGIYDVEAIEVAELMVRYRLLLSTGEIADVARTDPQTHHVAGVSDRSGEHTDSDDVSVSV